MERIKAFGWGVVEEVIFWGEVLGEVLGLDRNKYMDMVEEKQRGIEKAQELERKRNLYQRLNE